MKQDRYLFRGKRKLNGKWVYGSLLKDNDAEDWDFIVEDFEYSEYYPIRVITNTIGQYTGLKDKNDKMIFEDDVLTEDIKVLFMDGGYRTTYKGDQQSGTMLTQKRCETLEVIGNIHDNPELIEQN